MYYIYTLDSHEAYGPFTSKHRAQFYAVYESFKSYQVLPDSVMQQQPYHLTSLRLVPEEYR